MYQIEFTTAFSYGNEREGISVPVVLKADANSVRLAASVDTGATFCIFRNRHSLKETPCQRAVDAKRRMLEIKTQSFIATSSRKFYVDLACNAWHIERHFQNARF